jgi:hypothetical protein
MALRKKLIFVNNLKMQNLILKQRLKELQEKEQNMLERLNAIREEIELVKELIKKD